MRMKVTLSKPTRAQVDREILFLVGVLVILPIGLDIVSSYVGREATNAARVVTMWIAYIFATRYESNKLRRGR